MDLKRIAAVLVCLLAIYAVIKFQAYYFNRPDVQLRRIAKANLPQWIKSIELFLFSSCYLVLALGILNFVGYMYGYFHPGMPIASSNLNSNGGENIRVFIPLIVALPISMMLANFIAWSIPAIRKIEDFHAKGVPGASFAEANKGLMKMAIILIPICLILLTLGIIY